MFDKRDLIVYVNFVFFLFNSGWNMVKEGSYRG